MQSIGFIPDLILNVGVGACHPELFVWRRNLPRTLVLGVDIRLGRGLWDALSIETLVGAESGTVPFCWKCHSVKCKINNHEKHRRAAPITTIDDIVFKQKRKLHVKLKSIFLWMDIEGSEVDALKGSTKTLPLIPLLNIECCDNWELSHTQTIQEFLGSRGYSEIEKYGDDVLYQRTDFHCLENHIPDWDIWQ